MTLRAELSTEQRWAQLDRKEAERHIPPPQEQEGGNDKNGDDAGDQPSSTAEDQHQENS